jgi:hypothetical protein
MNVFIETPLLPSDPAAAGCRTESKVGTKLDDTSQGTESTHFSALRSLGALTVSGLFLTGWAMQEGID